MSTIPNAHRPMPFIEAVQTALPLISAEITQFTLRVFKQLPDIQQFDFFLYDFSLPKIMAHFRARYV